MNELPENLYHLFWDIKIDTFDPFMHPEYTISRILEFGDKEEVAWLRKNFPESKIKEVIKSDRKLSPKSANFWAKIFNISLNEVAALKNNSGRII